MAIVKDSVNSQRGSGGDRTVSAVVNAVTDVLVAVVTTQDSNTNNLGAAGITRDGQNFSKVTEQGGSGGAGQPNNIQIWTLINPNVGTADCVADCATGINESTLTVYKLSGADYDDLIADFDGGSTSGAPPAMSVDTLVDSCFLIGGICSEPSISGVGSGQTSDATLTDQSFENTRVSSEAGGVAGAQAHSYSLGSSGPYAQAVIAINPASSTSSPTVTTSAATSVTGNSAVGNGNVTSDGGATVTERGFAYGTSANPTTAGSKVVVAGTTGAYTGDITGLSPNTLYHYRAYATNSEGTSYGADTEFTTSAATVPTVSNGVASQITKNSVVVAGNVTSAGGSVIIERGFVLSTSPTPTINDTKFLVGGGTGSFSLQITKLKARKTYYVRAFARNSYGVSYG